jgi:hypothetical protein
MTTGEAVNVFRIMRCVVVDGGGGGGSSSSNHHGISSSFSERPSLMLDMFSWSWPRAAP